MGSGHHPGSSPAPLIDILARWLGLHAPECLSVAERRLSTRAQQVVCGVVLTSPLSVSSPFILRWSRRRSGVVQAVRLTVGGVLVRLRRPRAETLASATLTGLIALALLLAGPGPADAPAHLYRAMLVRHDAFLWDNFWFGGQYPLVSYSLLYYLPAAVVGNVPLVLGATVASTILFAVIARREWGDAATWPARAFAVLAAAPMFTGLYAYSVGFAIALGALAAMQRGRRVLAVLLGAATLSVSPLAFGFLVLLLTAFALGRRTPLRTIVAIGLPLVVFALIQLGLMSVFRSGGLYPFHAINLAGLLIVCASGALFARGVPGGRPIVALYGLWAAGSLLLFVVPTPFGDNWTRLSAFVFPVSLLTAILSRWQPRWLAALAVSAALAYNVVPYALLVPLRLDTRAQKASFWAPALMFLQQNATPDNRIEVVPTATHWESYLFPRNGYAIARGWYQQLDMTENAALYGKELTPAAYRTWLRRRGVRYVVLARTRLDSVAAPEGRLLRSGAARLAVVMSAPTVVIYELRPATPILTGPALARIRTFEHTKIVGWVRSPGRYLLRARYVPYYRVRPFGCVRKASSGDQSWLILPRAGRFVVDVPQSPTSIWSRAVHGAAACKPSTVVGTSTTSALVSRAQTAER